MSDSYRLAERQDMLELHRLTGSKELFRFPTVVARREGQVIGVMATIPNPTEVYAGVLWVEPSLKMPGRIILKLEQAYSNVLRMAKVEYYVWGIDKVNPLAAYVERAIGTKPYAEDEETFYYQRFLNEKEAA